MKSRFIVGICLVSLLLFSACTPQATVVSTSVPVQPTVAPTSAPVQPTQPPAATPAQPKPVTLNVFAAASLTAAFNEIGKAFEAKNPGTTVTFNFAGSQQLAQQINSAAPADVFASANQTQMDAVIKGGRIDQGASKTFANNRLVVIYPKANPAGIQTLQDLAKPGVKLILADKAVPVGQYALNFLDNAAKDTTFGAGYKDAVMKNVVSFEQDVKSVLTKVTLGEADAGIVYTTDAATDTAGKISQLEIPDSLNVIAVYPLAGVKDSPNLASAQSFVDFVLSADGQAIIAKYGFIPVD